MGVYLAMSRAMTYRKVSSSDAGPGAREAVLHLHGDVATGISRALSTASRSYRRGGMTACWSSRVKRPPTLHKLCSRTTWLSPGQAPRSLGTEPIGSRFVGGG